MIQIIGLVLIVLLAFHWKLALMIAVFLYYFGWPF